MSRQITRVHGAIAVVLAAALVAAPRVEAQVAVIDVHAIAQLATEINTLQNQLVTARNHLAAAQAEFASITGGRGMEQLLAGIVRNYLPSDWSALQGLAAGGGTYGALGAAVTDALALDAVLSPQQLAVLSPTGRRTVEDARRTISTLQALTHQALSESSNRFARIQQLIDAIPAARDQKGILDLQARIGTEQGMLANEQNKLGTVYASLQAEQWANQARAREQVVAGHGDFAGRFQPALP